MPLVHLGLGSNLAHPRRQIARAVRAIGRLPRSRIEAVSPNYVSAPVDCAPGDPDFVNAVVAIRTALAPHALLGALHSIERRQHRRRGRESRRNAARTLDIDLLLYDRRQMHQPALTLPHPRMHERAFVLRPLTDIAPSASIPGRGLARNYLRTVRSQRIARTRTHFLR